uniref:Immunoglobulin V-set domain-containing protein n=1 Tax=Myripristis murdjan TaxID=586833 RepID=A0A667WCR6_9TELE
MINLFLTDVHCGDLTPVKNEESSLEGSNITLSYKYSEKAAGNDYFFWYRQDPGKPPEFLFFHLGTGSGARKADPNSGLYIKVNEEKTQMDLEISSAAVTHSALYYCAVRPTVTGNTQSLYKNLTCPHRVLMCSNYLGAQ